MFDSPERVRTGIDELDKMLSGGLIRGTTILVQGAPGVGKTTLGLQFLYEGVTKYDEPGLLVTFEEFPASLYRDGEAIGWDLHGLEQQGKLRVVFTSPEIFLASLQATSSPITDLIQDWNVKRVVLDSVTMFRRVTSNPVQLRETYNHLINGLKRERLTCMLTSEDQIQTVSLRQQGMLGFIVDGVILMRYVEVSSAMQKAMTILKMRGIDHDRMIHRFTIEQGGVKIKEPFEGLEGLLSGSSHSSK